MRVLVLSFYYPPDLSAGSFRAAAFVSALSRQLSSDARIDVVTSAPNRYSTFARPAPAREEQGNVTVSRIRVFGHKSRMLDQSTAFMRFAIGVLGQVRGRRYDMVWATSSRLFTASLGALVARRGGIPLYLDIRDIFTETIEDLLPSRVLRPLWAVLRQVERFTVQSAHSVNLISEGFAQHFQRIAPVQRYTFFPNGIDEEFLSGDFNKIGLSDRDVILYAGNIGEGQGLHRIVPECAKRFSETIEFWVVGDGGAKGRLESALRKCNVTNVRIIPPVDRSELMRLYRESDYLFLHLNDHEAFRRVLPSKVFEYAATGKPIIAGVSGYAKNFIGSHVENAVVFEPCNAAGFASALTRLGREPTPREAFIRKFRRREIMERMVDDVLGCLNTGGREMMRRVERPCPKQVVK